MVLDECAEPLDPDYLAQALSRTHAWAERCKAAHSRPDQALFGIVQGGIYPALRRRAPNSDRAGLSRLCHRRVGCRRDERADVRHAGRDLPASAGSQTRYLMGVGAPEDIVEAVARGVDLFDCVLPTRIARNGTLLTPTGRFNIRNARFAEDSRPIQEDAPAIHAAHSAAHTCVISSSAVKSAACVGDDSQSIFYATVDGADSCGDCPRPHSHLFGPFFCRTIASPISGCGMNSAGGGFDCRRLHLADIWRQSKGWRCRPPRERVSYS